MPIDDRNAANASRIARIGAAVAILSLAQPISAEVFEIASDGTISIRTGASASGYVGAGAPVSVDEAGDGSDWMPDDLAVPDEALSPSSAPPAPAAYSGTVMRLAEKYELSPALIEALVWQESRWKANALSPKGAIGLAQLMPATARSLGIDPRDPNANLEGGARFLRSQLDLFDGNLEKALAAYNAGPRRVLAAGGIPDIAETRAYVAAIVGRLTSYSDGE